MDITLTHPQSDKENQAPSPSKVSYPQPPRVSPVKGRQQEPRLQTTKNHPTVPHHTDGGPSGSTVQSSDTPATIGRSRLPGNLVSRLQQTPPRVSRAGKMKGIFTESESRCVPFGNDSSTGSSSSEEDRLIKKSSAMNAAAPIWRQPPSSGQLVGDANSSSDEWTGDEEYIPKSAREKARMIARAREERRAARRDLGKSSDVRSSSTTGARPPSSDADEEEGT